MDASKTYVTIYNITPDHAQDFEFDYDVTGSDFLSELVPDLDNWGGVGWMEAEEYEYDLVKQTINFTLETKWASPVEWLRNASAASHYFENKLFVMTSIQKDETCVTGVAVMDGEVLQNKYIFEMPLEEVAKHYQEEDGYELDDLDNKIWDSINKFVNVCEQFYLEKED